jgi:hypothetical protein|tara:strand:+ start:979 stop:1188 length:210 start_codon:yes stop_codon:yes gene_type:complete
MEYSEITCGIRVMTIYGPGVVVSYGAVMPDSFCGGLFKRTGPLMAWVQLDCGAKNEFQIEHLTREGGES